MQLIRVYRKKILVFLAVSLIMISSVYVLVITGLPGQITLIEGKEYVYNLTNFFPIKVEIDGGGILEVDTKAVKSESLYGRLSNPIALKSNKLGSTILKIKVFGLIPLKDMKVEIVPNKKIVACGNTVGVKLDLNGILVIGISDVQDLEGKRIVPSKESDIKTGDLIVEINGKRPEGIDNLIDEIDSSKGEKITFKIKRGDYYTQTEVKPIMSSEDKKYRLGLWVRDSTAGIGTLTFYDPETLAFGALGHGITDIDTGIIMPVENGEVLESNVMGIKKGKPGVPGELKGVFLEDRSRLGKIDKNVEGGIYGYLNYDSKERVSGKTFPIALKGQIKEGAATILANIDGDQVKEYNIEIQKVSKNNSESSRGMVIKITDDRLLELTGGIVQGMSGSPILQNNQIVGAVTHVLVNDPTRGYGIFIEGMLKGINSEISAEKAG